LRLLLKTIAIIFVVWSSNGYGANKAKAPVVSVITPTNSQTPTWSWERGDKSQGNENYRYKLNNGDLTSGATSTTNTNYAPGSPLSDGTHTLYVQEQDGDGLAWSKSGSAAVVIDSIAPTMTITAAKVSDGGTSNDSTLSLTFTASESTSNFAEDDISVSGGTLSKFRGSGTTYTATFTPSQVVLLLSI